MYPALQGRFSYFWLRILRLMYPALFGRFLKFCLQAFKLILVFLYSHSLLISSILCQGINDFLVSFDAPFIQLLLVWSSFSINQININQYTQTHWTCKNTIWLIWSYIKVDVIVYYKEWYIERASPKPESNRVKWKIWQPRPQKGDRTAHEG